MAGSYTAVHAARPISLAENAQQIDPGLKITGHPGNAGSYFLVQTTIAANPVPGDTNATPRFAVRGLSTSGDDSLAGLRISLD
jgi:hypothetical protein